MVQKAYTLFLLLWHCDIPVNEVYAVVRVAGVRGEMDEVKWPK